MVRDGDELPLAPHPAVSDAHGPRDDRPAPSLRNRGFLAQDRTGGLGLYYSTSQRVLWTGDAPFPGPQPCSTPKADGAFLVGPDDSPTWICTTPTRRSACGRCSARSGTRATPSRTYVWQSTGGSDEFESKLSLTPLMIGTLKGTLYSLFLADPAGRARRDVHLPVHARAPEAATSSRRWRSWPPCPAWCSASWPASGSLRGWSRSCPALLLMLVVCLPLLVILAGRLPGSCCPWIPEPLPRRLGDADPTSVAGRLGIWVCLRLNASRSSSSCSAAAIQDWLLDATGLRYDQRNAVVVGLAMGFAVIPIIFSIAEDAFSNVPRNLVSGSLALGANRWQTVTRVVLPTASPGIFSAIMIGFGRAVGETMIVLMATGNTPIMDWNPFNGFRTLSANIAVEIPEAPQGGTLYRTLFLAALILFVFTFLINTVAELVRQRLRKRYAEI